VATIARDSFAGPPGAAVTARPPEVGARGWEYEVGTANLVIGSGRLHCEATTERIAIITAPTTPNYRADFDVWPASLLAHDETGVVGRMVGPNDWYGACYNRSTGAWQLLKKTTAGGLVVLGSYEQALTASVLHSGALVMEGDRIRLLTANVGEDHVERATVTDTSLTAAGEAGLRFIPGTAHTATTGLQLEGVRVSAKRRVDTSWLSAGTGRVSAGLEYLLGGPRVASTVPRRGVIVGTGANGRPAEAYEEVRALAEAGLTTIVPESWVAGANGVGFGNSSVVARWRAAWDHLKANHGVKTDKALLVGTSGGGYNALKYAMSYPTEVAAIALEIPAVNLKDIYDRNVNGFAQQIRHCYGGTVASFKAAEPTANAWNRLEELEGIPVYCWWSEDDPHALPEFAIDITEQVTTAKGESIGSIGHWYGPHGLSYTADVVEFLMRYRS